ncbi:serine/arginine repetitive matrix protein 2 isoform X4 [Scophthalmus maximus]|nr:serine/arginine repetitive matrix protein 2 isoform X4 [Scophthalmus maximus]
MNLNKVVLPPDNKARSVKLNARNLRVLQIETVTQESKEIEEKLQQLKRSMSKEKEERGHSGGFKWKSGRCGSLDNKTLKDSAKEDKKNRLQKLSAGKMKIRILKDEPLTAPPQPPPLPPAIGPRTPTRNRLKGPICGQCEVKTAGLNCAECTENYCIGCFARFHQKGALKLHRMIPFQTELRTHVSTRDVLSYSPSTSTSPSSNPVTSLPVLSSASSRRGGQSPEMGREAVEKPLQTHPDTSQVLVANRAAERRFEMGLARGDEKGFPTSLLSGEYNEEESASSFQAALRQWRGETSDGAGDATSEVAMWIPLRPVSAIAIQADLPPDREAEGQESGGGKGRMTLRVEFTEDNLTYMDRLLLKKHRRLPIQTYDPSLAFRPDLKSDTNTKEEEVESSLTAREEDFRRYCASLFAVPVTGGRTQTQIATPEPCLVIEVLDEKNRDINGVCAEQRTNNKEVPLLKQVSSDGGASVPQTALTGVGSSGVGVSPHSPTQASRHSSRAPTEPKTALELGPPKPQTSKAEHAMKSLPSKSLPSPCPTAETTRTSQTSIKTPNSKSQKPTCSPAVPKSKAHHEIPNLLCFPPLFPSDVSLAGTRSPLPKEPLSPSPSASFSLRSKSALSPSSSTEVTLFPEVRHSTPLRQRSDSSLQPEQSQSSNLFQEPISSPMLSQSAPSNLEAPEQSQHSLSDPDSFLSDNELKLPQSSGPNPRPKSLEPTQSQTNPAPFSTAVKTLSSSFNQSPSEVNSREKSTPSYGDATVYTSSPSFSGDPESTHQARQDTKCIPSISSHPLNVVQNHPFTVRMKEEEELSMDSGDEMSSDSLDLASHDGGSSDEDAQMRGRLTRRRSREGEQGISATSHLGDSFVPAHADVEKDLQTDEPERLSEEPYTVTHNWSAGSGSERLSSLRGLSPRRVDLNSAHSDTPEHTHFDPGSTESESPGPSGRLSTNTEGHLFLKMDNNMQATGIQIRSATTSRRGETSAYEQATSASNWSGKSSPTLPHPAKTTPSPLPEHVSPCLSHSPSRPPRSACLSRPTSGSELSPAFRLLSRAAQQITENCGVDQTGCGDSDLDTAAHTLCGLEQGLPLMAPETGTHRASSCGEMNSGSRTQHGSQ